MRQHLAARRLRHQPGAVDVGAHHLVEALVRHLRDQGDVVHARGHHEDVDPTKGGDARFNDGLRVRLALRTSRDGGDGDGFVGERGRHPLQLFPLAAGQHQLAAGPAQGDRGHLTEGPGRTGDHGDLALDVEQARRVYGRKSHGRFSG